MAAEVLVAIAFAFGVTNKLADLMNEHGLYWFRCCNLLFGFIWGGLGALLILAGAALQALFLWATAQAIHVLLSIEGRARESAALQRAMLAELRRLNAGVPATPR